MDICGVLSTYVMFWTGRAKAPMHPKHFYTPKTEQEWYAKDIEPTDTVLDIGANLGAHTDGVLHAKRIWATDIAIHALPIWKDPFKAHPHVQLCLNDIIKGLPFASGSIDKALFLDVLEHLHLRNEALREVHRVLRPNGLLLLSVPNVETTHKQNLLKHGVFHYMDDDHKIEYSWPQLVEELESNGFSVLKKEGIVFDTPWRGIVDLVGAFIPPIYRWYAQRRIDLGVTHPEESVGFRVWAQRV